MAETSPTWTPPAPRVIEVMPGKLSRNKNRNRSIRGPEIRQLAADHIKEKIGKEIHPDKVKFPRWTKFHKTIPYHWHIQGHEDTKAKLEKIMYDISPNNWKVEEYEIVKKALENGSLCVVPRVDGVLDLSQVPSPVMIPIEQMISIADLEDEGSPSPEKALHPRTPADRSKKRGNESPQKMVVSSRDSLPTSGARRKRVRLAQNEGVITSSDFVEVIQDDSLGERDPTAETPGSQIIQPSISAPSSSSSSFFDLMNRMKAGLGMLESRPETENGGLDLGRVRELDSPIRPQSSSLEQSQDIHPDLRSNGANKPAEAHSNHDNEKKIIEELSNQLRQLKSQQETKDEYISSLEKKLGDQRSEIAKLNVRIKELETHADEKKS